MTGREIIEWIQENGAEDMDVWIQGGEDLGAEESKEAWIDDGYYSKDERIVVVSV